MSRIFLSIGSNLGDRQANCEMAMAHLTARGVRIIRASAMHETKPWGVLDQPDFMNLAVEADSSHDPRALLSIIKQIELDMGRVASRRWGPRLIDIDILLYDMAVLDEPDLVVPHPQMHERAFVLDPLCEIAPDVMHPILNKSASDLLRALAGD